MDRTYDEISRDIILMRDNIRKGLSSIGKDVDWLNDYDVWCKKAGNQFESLLTISDPFNLSCVGDNEYFDKNDPNNMVDLEIYCMSIYLSEKLKKILEDTFSSVRAERVKQNKKRLIEEYLSLVDRIVKNVEISYCILTLHNSAEARMAMQGSRTVDLYDCFFSLKENMRMSSVETLYLLFTYWRITKNENDLAKLLSSIADYIQTFYYEYGQQDKEMHLDYPLERLPLIQRANALVIWLKHVAFHTNNIFEKYQELKWLFPGDSLADHIIVTDQISPYEMLQYRLIFPSDSEKIVMQKGLCMHGYGVWIRTVDVMYIVCDLFQVLYHSSDSMIRSLGTTKKAMLEQYDNMVKIRDYFTGKIFFHKVFFQLERHYIDSQVMEALEDDADQFSQTIDNVIDYVDAIASDNIDNLMQAKQSYISTTTGYMTDDQKEKIDELTDRVIFKIKETVQRLDIYNELYNSVANDFLKFAHVLLRHSQILCSLVSAEYLFSQYIKNKEPNERFDYSCISIMYYVSLEDFLNKLIYTPYESDVLSTITIKSPKDKSWAGEGYKEYVSSAYIFWDKRKKCFKTSCEIGVVGCLLSNVENEKKFKEYIKRQFEGIDTSEIEKYGNKLINIAQRRNDAAHGGNYLSYNDVCTDKDNVYNTNNLYRGLILELLSILFETST